MGSASKDVRGASLLSNHVQRLEVFQTFRKMFQLRLAFQKEKDEVSDGSCETMTLLLPVSGSAALLSMCGLGALV